jgi:hypothetical protein
MADHIPTKTLDFLLEWVRDVPEKQLKDAEYLNLKVIQIFTGASVVIGLAGLSNATPTGASHPNQLATILILVGLVCYFGVAVATWLHLANSTMADIRDPNKLWTEFWNDPVPTIQHSLIDATGKAYTKNEQILKNKAARVQLALLLTGLETVLVTAALIVTRVS